MCIVWCWQNGAQDVKNHRWFRNVDWDEVVGKQTEVIINMLTDVYHAFEWIFSRIDKINSQADYFNRTTKQSGNKCHSPLIPLFRSFTAVYIYAQNYNTFSVLEYDGNVLLTYGTFLMFRLCKITLYFSTLPPVLCSRHSRLHANKPQKPVEAPV